MPEVRRQSDRYRAWIQLWKQREDRRKSAGRDEPRGCCDHHEVRDHLERQEGKPVQQSRRHTALQKPFQGVHPGRDRPEPGASRHRLH